MWGVLLALAATTVFLILQPPLYRSEATVFVRTPGDVSRVLDGGDSYAQGRARTYAALAGSTSVSSRVIADLGLDLKPEILSKRIQATNPPGTALIDIAVSAPSAAEAQRTATCCSRSTQRRCAHWNRFRARWFRGPNSSSSTRPGRPARVVAWGAPIPVVPARRSPDRAGPRFDWRRCFARSSNARCRRTRRIPNSRTTGP